MKAKKLGILAVLLAMFAASLNAQPSSNTSNSTEGLFGTDVDDFTNVNSWQNVQPENLFGYVYVNASQYNLGIAKQFGNIYWGSNFTGDIGNFHKTVTTTTTGSSTTTETESTSRGSTSDGTSLRFTNLIGIGNFGVRLYLYFYDYYSEENADYKTTDLNFGGNVSAGYNFKAGSTSFTPYFSIAYYNYPEKTTYKRDYDTYTEGDWTDSSDSHLYFRAGTGIDFAERGIVQNSLSLDLNSYIYFYPDNASSVGGVVTSQASKSNADVTFTPKYALTVKPLESLAFKVGASAQFYYYHSNDGSSVATVTDRFTFTPGLSAAVTYKIKDQLQLNGGVGVTIPGVRVTSEKHDTTTTKTASAFSTTPDLDFSTGFLWTINQHINFDCSWNVISSIVDCCSTDWSQVSTQDALFGNLNKLLFTNLSFILSVKF